MLPVRVDLVLCFEFSAFFLKQSCKNCLEGSRATIASGKNRAGGNNAWGGGEQLYKLRDLRQDMGMRNQMSKVIIDLNDNILRKMQPESQV